MDKGGEKRSIKSNKNPSTTVPARVTEEKRQQNTLRTTQKKKSQKNSTEPRKQDQNYQLHGLHPGLGKGGKLTRPGDGQGRMQGLLYRLSPTKYTKATPLQSGGKEKVNSTLGGRHKPSWKNIVGGKMSPTWGGGGGG